MAAGFWIFGDVSKYSFQWMPAKIEIIKKIKRGMLAKDLQFIP